MELTKFTSAEPGKWRQTLAAVIVNIASLSVGVLVGWISPMVLVFLSPNNPLSKDPLSIETISWLQSALFLSGLVTFPFCSLISEKFGRKIIGYLIVIALAASWLLTIFSANFQWLLFGRVLAGMGGTFLFFLAPLYVTEISGDSIRGFLGSFMIFSINIGTFLAYILGTVLSYQLFAICALLFAIIFFGCFLLMPETPIYLVRNNRITHATRSLMWLKNGDQSAVHQELLKLQTQIEDYPNTNKIIGICDLFRDRATIKGFIIANVLLSGQHFCGIVNMLTYASMIFQMAGSSLSPNIATIIIGGTQIIGSLLSTLFIERAGRRLLIQISCFGMLLCYVALATFILLQSLSIDVSSFRWLPLVAFSIYIITYNAGLGPAAYIVASEIFNSDISALGCSVCMAIKMAIGFAEVKSFPIAIQLLNLYGCFYLLAVFCGCILLFTYFFVPETKGRSIESIVNDLNRHSGGFNKNGYMKASIVEMK